jgi:hypothetical protein
MPRRSIALAGGIVILLGAAIIAAVTGAYGFGPAGGQGEPAPDATGRSHISQQEAERKAIGSAKPTKVRSYLLTYGKALQLSGSPGAIRGDPNREVGLVIVQAPGQGSEPSMPAGMKPWPKRYYFVILDAVTGAESDWGMNGVEGPDWPAWAPADPTAPAAN